MPRKAFLLFFTAFLLLPGCRRKSVGIARVGPLVITREEYQDKIAEVNPEFRAYLETQMGRRQFLDILVREKLKLAAAQDSDAAGSAEIQEGLREMRERHALEEREFREHRMVELWRQGLRAKGVLNVSEEDIDQFLRDYSREIRLRHILVGDPDDAKKLYERAQKGESFAALAKEHSLDAETAADGGLLPPFLYREVLPELSDVAFRMATGEVNGVIRSKFGYHVLKKEGADKLSPSNKEVRARVQDLLEKRQFDEYLAGLRERYPVEVYDETFR